MVLRAIAAFFKIILEGTAKVIAFLLVSLGLWLAAVYSLLFVIIAAFSSAPLSTMTTPYLCGLVLSVIGGFALTLAVKRPSKNFPVSERRQSAVKLKETQVKAEFKDTVTADLSSRTEKDEQTRQQPPALETDDKVETVAPVTAQAEPAAPDTETFCVSETQNANYESGEEGEQPLIFALRRDPTVFVCEYSRKTEYYKRTRQGMVLLTVEYKPGKRARNNIHYN